MHWALFWVFGLHQCTKATNISVLVEFQFSWRKKTKDNKQKKKRYIRKCQDLRKQYKVE